MTKMAKVENSSSNYVAVGCKLPSGLHLDLYNGIHRVPGQRVTLKGSAKSNIIGGYGITRNVPVEFWNKWVEQNKDNPVLVNRQIFAHTQVESVKAEGRDLRSELTGFEPLDPNNPLKSIDEKDKNRQPRKSIIVDDEDDD